MNCVVNPNTPNSPPVCTIINETTCQKSLTSGLVKIGRKGVPRVERKVPQVDQFIIIYLLNNNNF